MDVDAYAFSIGQGLQRVCAGNVRSNEPVSGQVAEFVQPRFLFGFLLSLVRIRRWVGCLRQADRHQQA